MWKKWLAFSGMLALIVLLDPSPTPAQPGGGGGKGGKGGFGRPDGGGGYGAPGGGTGYGAPAAPGGTTYVVPMAPGGGYGAPGGMGGMGGYGQRPDGGKGGFGGQRPDGGMGGPGGGMGGPGGGMGGPGGGMGNRGPGGGGGGGGNKMDPEFGWKMLQGLTGDQGDTVDLSKIAPERRQALNGMAQRFGTNPLPESGVWSKATYLEFNSANEALRAAKAADGGSMDPNRGRGMGGFGGPGGGMGGPGNWDPNNWNQQNWDLSQRPGFEKKETEEEKPVAMRYGKLPKDLPSWYDELDVDKDGQVSLYEWFKTKKETKEFTEMDLNGDGLITADEYLRFARQKNIDTKIAAYDASGGTERPKSWDLGAPDAKGGEKGPRGPGYPGKSDRSGSDKGSDTKGGDKGDRSGEKGGGKDKGNPWSKKN